jgi:hypothetical protein
MIRVAHHQRDGPSRILAWDRRTVVFDSSTSDTNEMNLLEFTLGMIRIGYFGELYSEEFTEFMQLMIAWVKGSQMDSCIITLHLCARRKECLISSR